jgi:AraC-like DNA-binding protein
LIRSFSDRILERRLQKARAMLADPRHAGTKISEMAFAYLFIEISYFNQAFRRRFGASPTRGRDWVPRGAPASGLVHLSGRTFRHPAESLACQSPPPAVCK